MPVNHAIDRPRELTMSVTNEIMGLERMDRKTGAWQAVKLDFRDNGRTTVLTCPT